jgi:hypothetical protein
MVFTNTGGQTVSVVLGVVSRGGERQVEALAQRAYGGLRSQVPCTLSLLLHNAPPPVISSTCTRNDNYRRDSYLVAQEIVGPGEEQQLYHGYVSVFGGHHQRCIPRLKTCQ